MEPASDTLSGLVPDREQQNPRGLSKLPAEHARIVRGERVSLGEIADFLGNSLDRGLAADPGIANGAASADLGISVLFGVPLMIISTQLTLGGRRAWRLRLS